MVNCLLMCKVCGHVEGLVIDQHSASIDSEARDEALAAFLKEQGIGPWRRSERDPGSKAHPSSLFFGGSFPLASERARSTREEGCHLPLVVATIPCTSSKC